MYRKSSKRRQSLVDGGFCTTREAAEFLGISIRQVQRLIQGGVLSHARHGKRIVIPWLTVKDYAALRLVEGTVV